MLLYFFPHFKLKKCLKYENRPLAIVHKSLIFSLLKKSAFLEHISIRNLIITKYDKSSQTARFNKMDYVFYAEAILNSGPYYFLIKDPSTDHHNKVML